MKERDAEVKAQFDTGRIDAQLKKWRERLLDLTKSNPLLGINRSRVSKLLVNEPSPNHLFQSIVLQGQTLKMPLVRKKAKKKKDSTEIGSVDEMTEVEYIVEPGDVDFAAQPKDLFRLIRRIFDNGKTTLEERGVTTLHLTFGTLKWDDPILGESSSPLLMVPCQLESFGPNAHMRLKMADEELQVNPALELYLRERHRVSISQSLDEPNEGTLDQFLNQIKQVVSEQGWQVEDSSWLSTFSFESLVIYKDLWALSEAAYVNPIVAAFARASSASESSESLGEDLDEGENNGQVPISVMPADASQLQALSLASVGNHLVIHGPPGTGKSQTITNLIADALGAGKKVLFVSSKMAALDVVFDRLRKLHLDRYCLEAHSTKAGKAKIIEELKRTLEMPISGGGAKLGEQLSELKKTRTQLNDYVKALHQLREPLGLTVYEAVGKVEKLQLYPTLDYDLPWADVLSVNNEELRDKAEVLEQLSIQSDIFDNQVAHPWYGLVVAQDDPVKSETLKSELQVVATSFADIFENLQSLSNLLIPYKRCLSLSDIRKLDDALRLIYKGGGLPTEWINRPTEQLGALRSLFESATSKSQLYERCLSEHQMVSNLTPGELISVLEPLNSEFTSWTRIVKPRFWKWKKDLRKNLLPNVDLSYSALRTYIKKASELEGLASWFAGCNSELSKYIANPLGNSKQLQSTSTQFGAAEKLRAAIHDKVIRAPSEEVVISEQLRQAAQIIVDLINNEKLTEAVDFVNKNWPSGFIQKESAVSSEIDRVAEKASGLLESMQKLHEWTTFQSILGKCKGARLESFLNNLRGSTTAKNAPQVFEKGFYHRWVETVIDSVPVLREFTGATREERIRHFKSLDEKIRSSTLRHIQSIASEPARSVTNAQATSVQGASEIGILRRELQRRRRIKPLRKLFQEIPHVLQAIKPCMLMSPLSVSTFLKPGSITFDLVVFDEASQLPTQEAIPSILRSKQVVVAGDENQLPPTSFFLASSIFEEEEGENEDDYAPLESLLDDCVAVVPTFKESKIIWHYRSKDERLIKFSNHYFYNNALITFPSTTTSSEGRGVHIVYTPTGVWDRGKSRTNRIEANEVAQIVVQQLRMYPVRSIGVVSMNAAQKEAIEYAIEELVAGKPELQALLDKGRPEPFFVKSLENVQGDERDTMIISVGYAKTADGALSLNFGPINRDGGWRRLNVLVTRAKWQIILVTSLQSHELRAISPNNKGAVMLRNFIEYAEHNSQLPADPATISQEETNDFEEAIAGTLRDRGLLVDEQVGASGYRLDLAIRDSRDPNCYVMAVECDGATYHSAKTARDRDMLRQEVLRSHGWKLHRVWSTDWFRDREKALNGILRSLEIAQSSPLGESMQAPPQKAELVSEEGDTEEAAGSFTSTTPQSHIGSKKYFPGQPYTKYAGRGGDKKVLLNPSRVYALADVVARIVQVESPIHESLLASRLCEMYRASRIGANIQRNIESAINIAVENRDFEKDELGFIHKNHLPPDGFRVPANGVERTISQIAPDEIGKAILYLVEDQFGFMREQLPKAILHLFGVARFRSESTEPILLATDRLIERGELRLNGYTLYLV